MPLYEFDEAFPETLSFGVVFCPPLRVVAFGVLIVKSHV